MTMAQGIPSEYKAILRYTVEDYLTHVTLVFKDKD